MPSTVERLLAPTSLAIVGASRDPRKWGNQLIRHTRQLGYAGVIYGVNPTPGAAIPGATLINNIAEAAQEVEVAFLAVPKRHTLQTLRECLEVGVRTVVVPASGFAERSTDGAALQRKMLQMVRDNEARLVGPNCFGVYSSVGSINLTPFGEVPRGRVALVSQSGNVAAHAFIGAERRRFGFSHCVGVGNQLDVSFTEVLAHLKIDDNTAAVALYVEGIPDGDGPAFMSAIRGCVSAGKPVIVLKGGVSQAGAAATASHTGSLSADSLVWRTAVSAAGGHMAANLDEMLDILALTARPVPKGNRVALITDGGGDSILGLDVLSEHGIVPQSFSNALQQHLDSIIPVEAPRSTGGNPLTLDTAGGVGDDPLVLHRSAAAVARSGEVDTIVVGGLFGTYVERRGEELITAERLLALVEETGVNLVMQSSRRPDESAPIRVLHDGGMPVFPGMVELARALRVQLASQPEPEPSDGESQPARPPAYVLDEAGATEGGDLLDPVAAAKRLSVHGVPMPTQVTVDSPDGLTAAAEEVGYPICLKIASADVVHKSDVGGVVVGIADWVELEAAASRVWTSFPEASVLLMPSFVPGFEVMVGARHDAQFGPVVVIGRGGIWAEIEQDVALLVGSFDAAAYDQALRSLRCWPILAGARGRPPLDTGQLRHVVTGVVDFIGANPDCEVDLNPVIVYQRGVAIADSRVLHVPVAARVRPFSSRSDTQPKSCPTPVAKEHF